MQLEKLVSTLPALALLATVPWLAQETGLVDFEGTQQDGEAPARERRGPDLVLVRTGADAPVLDADGRMLGFVREHVVDPRVGQVQQIAVDLGAEGGARLVPFPLFAWDAEERRLVLPIGLEQLSVMPVYVPRAEEPRSEEPRSEEGELEPAPEGERMLLAGELLGAPVGREAAAEDAAPLARVDALVLDPLSGRVAFVLAGSGTASDPHVIPWAVLAWHAPVEAERQGLFTLDAAEDWSALAPRLEGGALDALTEETLERIESFYEIAVPLGGVGTSDRG